MLPQGGWAHSGSSAYIHTYILYIRTYVRTYASTYCMYVCTYVCTYVSMYVCTYVCTEHICKRTHIQYVRRLVAIGRYTVCYYAYTKANLYWQIFKMNFTSSVQSTLLYVRTLSISCVLRYWYNYVICILHIMQTCMSNTTVHNEVFSILLPVAFVFPWNRSLCWHSRGRSHTFALSCLCVSGTHIADIAVGLLNNPFHWGIHNCLCSAHNSISVVIGSVSAAHLHRTAPHSLSDLLVKLCQSR